MEALKFPHFRGTLYLVAPNGQSAVRWVETKPGRITIVEYADDEGMSVTNAAETYFCQAWQILGRPWPCEFVEFYPDVDHNGTRDIVEFDLNHDEEPIVVSSWGDNDSFLNARWRRLSGED